MSRATIIAVLAIIGTMATVYLANSQAGNQRELAHLSLGDFVLRDLFTQWKSNFGKVYHSIEEETMRFQIFVENYRQILANNAEQNGVTLGLNQFADLNAEEFGAHIGCLNQESIESMNNFPTHVFEADAVPDEVDWRAKNAVTSVKNQAQCGGCWAFAAAATLESLNFITGGTLTDFSPQQMIDCATGCKGCNGCENLFNALNYTSQYGIESWSDYPYQMATQSCRYDKSKVVFKNKGYINVTPKNVDQLKAAIAQQPVEVGIQANQLTFQFYAGGVISKLCGSRMDHAVTAVGYGKYQDKDAFYVKNSWGQSWGVQGYVYISTDASANNGHGVCGILTAPALPTH